VFVSNVLSLRDEPAPSKLAVLALVPYKSGVLLGERGPAANGGVGEWGPPGGSVDPGEAPEDALRREIFEETGLVTVSLRPFSFTVGNYELRDGLRQVISLYYLAETVGEPVCCEPDKCTQWRGWAWDALPSPLFDGLATLSAQHPILPFASA
jgi:8-oxo-dGTP diphosphatase